MRLAGEGAEPRAGRASGEPVRPLEGGERLTRSRRLRRRQDFLRVGREGARVHTKHYVLIVLARAEQGAEPRLGITVTKKVAGSVGRNRVKRVLREVFRRNRHLFPEGCDVVIIAKSGAPDLGYEEARDELARVRGSLARAARSAGRRSPKEPR
jgi:ribonuclease P protein component